MSGVVPPLPYLPSQLNSNWTAFYFTHLFNATFWNQKFPNSELVKDWLQYNITWVSASVKDIRIESFVSGLLFVGIDSEIQREGVV